MASVLEYWKVQDTGWSGGVSWFDNGSSSREPLRFPDEASAQAYVQRVGVRGDPHTLWRIVHVHIEDFECKQVTTETWTPVNLS